MTYKGGGGREGEPTRNQSVIYPPGRYKEQLTQTTTATNRHESTSLNLVQRWNEMIQVASHDETQNETKAKHNLPLASAGCEVEMRGCWPAPMDNARCYNPSTKRVTQTYHQSIIRAANDKLQ